MSFSQKTVKCANIKHDGSKTNTLSPGFLTTC